MPDERVIDFAGQLRERERRRIDAVMEQGALEAAEEEKAAAARPKAPAPEKPRTMLEGVSSAAGSAAWDSFQHGVTNVAKAVYRGVNPAARIEDPFQVAAHGQGLLGVLQIVTAPYAGFGAAAQQALANYSPGKEREVAFKGGPNSWVGYFRTMLGVPQLLLDPETRKQDPQLTVKMLEEDMTYGEFLNILTATATGFVVTPGTVRAVGRRIAGKGPTEAPPPAPAPEAPPPTTLRAPDASVTQLAGGAPTQAAPAAPPPLPRTMGELQAQKGVPGAARGPELGPAPAGPTTGTPPKTMADLMAEKLAPTPEAPTAAAPEGGMRELGPLTPEQVAEQLRLSLEQPSAAEGAAPKAGAETPEAAPPPKHPLVETYEGAVTKAQEIIDEAFSEDVAAAVTPEEVAPEGVAAAAPETVPTPEGAAAAAAPASKPTDKAPATMRPAEINRELDRLEKRATAVNDQMLEAGRGYEKPSETRTKTDPLSQEYFAVQDRAAALRQEIKARMGPSALDRFPKGVRGFGPSERGSVSTELLARMAVGAAIGAVSGDEENAIRNGLIGLGVGAAVRGPLAAKLAVALKDQTGGIKWRSRPAVSKAQEPYQPNYSHVQAEAEVLHVMKNVHRAVADQITEGMKRPTTHSETTKAAAELITSGEVTPDSVLKGATVDIETLPAYGKAVRDLAVGSAAEVVRIAKAIEAGEAVPSGQIRQAGALTAELSVKAAVMKTRGGQFVEAFKIKTEDPGFIREASISPERVAEIADQMAPNATDAEFAKAILADARTPRVQEMMTFMQALPAALLEAMYGSMFSGVSILRNAFGTVVMAPLAIGARGAGSVIARAESLVHTPASRIVPGEAGGMLTAWWEGIHEQVSLMRSWKAWQEAAQGEGKLQEVHHSQRAIDRFADTLDPGPVQSIIRGVGQVIRKPLEVMNGTDASGKAIARRMELKAQAIRQATVEGLEGQALGTRVEEIMKDPAKLTHTARERVVEFGLEQTFTKDLEGTIGGAIQRGWQGDGTGGVGREWAQLVYRASVVPIFRTAVRIAEGQLDYSGNPVTSVLSKRFREDMLAGGARRQLAEGKMALGLTMTGLFIYMASQDWITGSAPEDPKKRALWGRPEQSFWEPLSGQYRSFKGFAPLSAWIRASADLWRYSQELPEMDYTKLIGMHALLTLDNLESESWWLGVSDLVKVFTDKHGKDEMVDAAMDVARKRLAQWSPGFLAEIEKGVDPAFRSSRPSGAIESPGWREYESLKARYATRTPFWSTVKNEQGRDLYPVQRDPLTGQPQMFDSWPFSVAPIQKDRRTPARNEIDRLQPGGIPLPDHIGGNVRATGIGLDPPRLAPATGILLGRDERDRWEEIMTQQVKDPAGQHLLPAIEKLVQSPMYLGSKDKPTSDLRKRELLSHKIDWFKERAEDQLLKERPDLHAAVRGQQIEKRIQRQSPVDQPAARERAGALIRGLTR